MFGGCSAILDQAHDIYIYIFTLRLLQTCLDAAAEKPARVALRLPLVRMFVVVFRVFVLIGVIKGYRFVACPCQLVKHGCLREEPHIHMSLERSI